MNQTQYSANFEKYQAIWIRHYEKAEFGGGDVRVAATYAAADSMNVVKGWSQECISDDIAYLDAKIA